MLPGRSVGDRAAAVLEQVVPDFPDTSQATVAGCTGVTLACWTTGCPGDPAAPAHLAGRPQLLAGTGLANAPAPALALAGKGRVP